MAAEAKDVWAYLQCSDDHNITESSLELLSEVRRLAGATGGKACALLVGEKVRHLVPVLRRYGVAMVYTHEDAELSIYCPEEMTSLLAEAIGKHSPLMVLFPGTHLGNDVACRVSVRIERRLFRNCVNFEVLERGRRLSVVRPVQGQYLYGAEVCDTPPFMATLIPGTVAAKKVDGAESALEVELGLAKPRRDAGKPEPVYVKGDPRTMDLVDADVIVAGGRGAARPEGLTLLQQLADELGGSLGVSRPLVDDKWAPFERQVGQTGRTVRPKLYMACGISGAIQHIMGMRDSSTIVAINKDPMAPIFDVAAVAAEGDLFQIVPELIRRIRDRKAHR
jgi:electron transfer flavoprotein alpha subunit